MFKLYYKLLHKRNIIPSSLTIMNYYYAKILILRIHQRPLYLMMKNIPNSYLIPISYKCENQYR